VRPLELVLNLFLLLSLLPVAAAAQVPSPLLALCRMPPVKGRSKLPYGPCANAACCFSIDIRCGCRCGHDDERDAVPEHHIFHPECCAAAADDPALLGDEVCRPCFPSAATLKEGRAFGVDMRASRRWYTVSDQLRDPRLGLQLLPEKAVLCPTCYALFNTWTARDIQGSTIQQLSAKEKMRGRAEDVLRRNVGLLPDWVLSALAGVVSLRYFQRGAKQRAVWRPPGFRVFPTTGGSTKLDVQDLPDGGGDVFEAGCVGSMAPTVKVLLLWVVQLSGSSNATPDARNALGCATVVKSMAVHFGFLFWAAVGRYIHDAMVAAAPQRLARITARTLTGLTPWKEDFKTLPKCLVWVVSGRVLCSVLCAHGRRLRCNVHHGSMSCAVFRFSTF
jgi:hypothetical protein